MDALATLVDTTPGGICDGIHNACIRGDEDGGGSVFANGDITKHFQAQRDFNDGTVNGQIGVL